MLNKLKQKIETKRESKNFLLKAIFKIKDFIWFLYWFLIYFLSSLKYIKIINKRKKVKEKIKVLYISDHPHGSITHLANIWLGNNSNIDYEIHYSNEQKIDRKKFKKYDLVFFGHLSKYLYDIHHLYDLNKSIITIHDKEELLILSDPKANFYEKKLFLYLLKRIKNLIVVSKEMHDILKKYEIDSFLIPTMGRFPFIDKNKIVTNKCGVCSVCSESWRKNPDLLLELKEYLKDQINFNLKIGFKIVNDDEYLKIIDENEIYICTSFIEGGPLPAIEAMGRGLVILSTPVGQMPELIINGENGFICNTKEDFIEKINLLNSDLVLLQKMRLKSREMIEKNRNINEIKKRVSDFIVECYLRS